MGAGSDNRRSNRPNPKSNRRIQFGYLVRGATSNATDVEYKLAPMPSWQHTILLIYVAKEKSARSSERLQWSQWCVLWMSPSQPMAYGEELERVEMFKYLGRLMPMDYGRQRCASRTQQYQKSPQMLGPHITGSNGRRARGSTGLSLWWTVDGKDLLGSPEAPS